MTRATVAMVTGLLLATAGPGCSWFDTDEQRHYGETLTPAEWQQLKDEDARRLYGEGIPRQASDDAPPPAQTGIFEGLTDAFVTLFWTLPARAFEVYLLNETPGRYARMMEDRNSPDNRRTGLLELASQWDFARADPYTRRYWQIAQTDTSDLVRAAAIRALNRSRSQRAVPVFIVGLRDRSALIRLESLKALANVPDANPDSQGLPLLRQHVSEQGAELGPRAYAPPGQHVSERGGRVEQEVPVRDLRVAAVDALRHYRTVPVALVLAGVLRDRQFEVAWQARQSLILMTGHDFGYDPERWKDYLNTPKPFG